MNEVEPDDPAGAVGSSFTFSWTDAAEESGRLFVAATPSSDDIADGSTTDSGELSCSTLAEVEPDDSS
jgi:hypothetical protein